MTEDKGPTVEELIAQAALTLRYCAPASRPMNAAKLASLRRIPLLEADLERMRGALEAFADVAAIPAWAEDIATKVYEDVFPLQVLPSDVRRARQALEAKHD